MGRESDWTRYRANLDPPLFGLVPQLLYFQAINLQLMFFFFNKSNNYLVKKGRIAFIEISFKTDKLSIFIYFNHLGLQLYHVETPFLV